MSGAWILLFLLLILVLVKFGMLFWAGIAGLALILLIVGNVGGKIKEKTRTAGEIIAEDVKRELEHHEKAHGQYPSAEAWKDLGGEVAEEFSKNIWAEEAEKYHAPNLAERLGNASEKLIEKLGEFFGVHGKGKHDGHH